VASDRPSSLKSHSMARHLSIFLAASSLLFSEAIPVRHNGIQWNQKGANANPGFDYLHLVQASFCTKKPMPDIRHRICLCHCTGNQWFFPILKKFTGGFLYFVKVARLKAH
jgi:hypothetical protein